MNNLKKIIIAGTVIIILAIIGIIYIVLFKVPDASIDLDNTPTENSALDMSVKGYVYDFVSNAPQEGEFNQNTFDGKIVKRDVYTGIETVEIESIKKAYPALQESFNKTFFKLSKSSEFPYLYLTIAYSETDSGGSNIVRYDGNTKTFIDLKTSPYFNSFISTVSPYAPFIATTNNIANEKDYRSLYILDLDKDEARLLTKLPVSETFNPCELVGCFGDNSAVINWIDANTFEIEVYAAGQAITDSAGSTQAKLIEKRKFKIN